MNEIIPFKKEIIFKTKIAKVTDISLTHDYKIKEGLIEGEFYLNGLYKMTEASVINEEFMYNIPFSIALGDNILTDTINLVIENYDYRIDKDVMSISINMNMTCEKKEKEIVKEINDFDSEIEDMLKENEIEEEVIPVEEPIDTESNINIIKESIKDENEYSTYKIYIVRGGDTYESVATKYNISLSDLFDYNKKEELNIGDKIIIPYIKNE